MPCFGNEAPRPSDPLFIQCAAESMPSTTARTRLVVVVRRHGRKSKLAKQQQQQQSCCWCPEEGGDDSSPPIGLLAAAACRLDVSWLGISHGRGQADKRRQQGGGRRGDAFGEHRAHDTGMMRSWHVPTQSGHVHFILKSSACPIIAFRCLIACFPCQRNMHPFGACLDPIDRFARLVGCNEIQQKTATGLLWSRPGSRPTNPSPSPSCTPPFVQHSKRTAEAATMIVAATAAGAGGASSLPLLRLLVLTLAFAGVAAFIPPATPAPNGNGASGAGQPQQLQTPRTGT